MKSEKNIEALNFAFYVSGFVDGEGCFSVSYRLNSKLSVGIEVRPSFSIAQKKSPANYKLLSKIRDTFNAGAIRDDGRGCYKYETRSLNSICKTVIPFFNVYPLRSDKKQNFALFCNICSRLEKKEHLRVDGLCQILEDSRLLNPSGTRRNPLDTLLLFLKKRA